MTGPDGSVAGQGCVCCTCRDGKWSATCRNHGAHGLAPCEHHGRPGKACDCGCGTAPSGLDEPLPELADGPTWESRTGRVVVDSDGWSNPGRPLLPCAFDTPISFTEWEERVAQSTVAFTGKASRVTAWINPYQVTKRGADTLNVVRERRVQLRLTSTPRGVERTWKIVGGGIGWRVAFEKWANVFLDVGMIDHVRAAGTLTGIPDAFDDWWREVFLTTAGRVLLDTWERHPFDVVERTS